MGRVIGVEVAAETFVVEERLWNGKTRNGACYRADNWKLVETQRDMEKQIQEEELTIINY